MMNEFTLSKRRAVVTGCNTGLGQGMALALARAGCDIVAANRTHPSELEAAVTALGRKFVNVRVDLADPTSIEQIVHTAVDVLGGLDVLVNNAGTIRRQDALAFTQSDWDDVMNVNLKSVFFLSQAAARQFVVQGTRGKIINVASMLSFQGGIRVASYTASKSGVVGLTRLLANEWAPLGINVNAIAPGYMESNNTAAIRADSDRNASILARIPAGRWGVPSDLDGPVVFLASAASDYVHGHTLAVDGGWLAR